MSADPHDVCTKCGYSLHGLESSRCPECGASVALSRRASRFSSPVSRLLRRLRDRWKMVAGCFVGLAVVAVALFTFAEGRVRVEEFCPQTFQFRSRSWYEVPLLQWRVSGDSISVRDTPLGDYLRARGVLNADAEATTWYFVAGTRYGLRGWNGVARRARHEFDLAGAYWIAESSGDPVRADAVWRRLVNLLQRDESHAAAAIRSMQPEIGRITSGHLSFVEIQLNELAVTSTSR